MDTLFAGKVALITGAAGGIGRAIAQTFATHSAHLALLDCDQHGLAEVVAELADHAPHVLVKAVVADLETEKGVQSGIDEALSFFDHRIDALIANVGVLINKRFEELTSDHWQRAFALNCFSHVFACQRVIPHMKRQGQGAIVFTGSDQGLQPEAGLAAYAMAKAATHALVKVLARELPPYHIFVSAVAPGMTETPLVRKLIQDYADNDFHTDFATAQRLELQRRGIPLARLLQPEEVAQAVWFLATSPFCNGSILNASGGNVRSVAS